MGLLSLFSRKPAAAASMVAAGDGVEQARARARRRLIGAAVLVGAGVIGFPLLFESQPRPIAVDVPIEIPRKDAVAPLPSPRPASAVTAAAPPADAGREAAPPVAAASTTVAADPASAPAKPAAAAVVPKPAAAPKPEKPAPAAEPATRMVVQVGAFADANTAREARQRVEKLGLKTYTQVIETDAGKRIRVRVGPFASRDAAEQAAARLKAAGLPAAVTTP